MFNVHCLFYAAKKNLCYFNHRHAHQAFVVVRQRLNLDRQLFIANKYLLFNLSPEHLQLNISTRCNRCASHHEQITKPQLRQIIIGRLISITSMLAVRKVLLFFAIP